MQHLSADKHGTWRRLTAGSVLRERLAPLVNSDEVADHRALYGSPVKAIGAVHHEAQELLRTRTASTRAFWRAHRSRRVMAAASGGER